MRRVQWAASRGPSSRCGVRWERGRIKGWNRQSNRRTTNTRTNTARSTRELSGWIEVYSGRYHMLWRPSSWTKQTRIHTNPKPDHAINSPRATERGGLQKRHTSPPSHFRAHPNLKISQRNKRTKKRLIHQPPISSATSPPAASSPPPSSSSAAA